MRYLYSALLTVLLPFALLRMLLRSRREPAYRRRLAQRFGIFQARVDHRRPLIWVHAVSLGEVLAAAPLVEELLQLYPGYQVALTTTTPTGSQQVQALFGERVLHVYAPWDLPGSVRRFLRRMQPRLLLIMETELWPNTLHYCHASGCRVILANARLSQRSAQGYARFGAVTRPMLACLDKVACQTQADAQRFLALGLPLAAMQVTGSIKFDLELDAALRSAARQFRQALAATDRPVLVAASTHPGEDEIVLRAFARVREVYDNCLLLLVPRHPQRCDRVHNLCKTGGWQVRRRSNRTGLTMSDDILLCDTTGELLMLLGAARVAVIGGSLVPRGGHNMLEAAAWGVPVVTGPSNYNFAEVSEKLHAAGALVALEETSELGPVLLGLLGNEQRCAQMGAAGQQVVAANRGARKQLLQLVAEQLQAG